MCRGSLPNQPACREKTPELPQKVSFQVLGSTNVRGQKHDPGRMRKYSSLIQAGRVREERALLAGSQVETSHEGRVGVSRESI